MYTRNAIGAALLLACLAVAAPACADVCTYIGLDDNSWTLPGVWDVNHAPTAGDTAVVGNGYRVIVDAPASCNTLRLGGQNRGPWGYLTINPGSTFSAVSELIGSGAPGQMDQVNGINNVSNLLVLGPSGGSDGYYTLNGGSLTTPLMYVGQGIYGSFYQVSGVCHVTTAMYMGCNSGAGGNFGMNDGIFTAPSVTIGQAGSGWYWQGSGTTTITSLVIADQYTGDPENGSSWSGCNIQGGNFQCNTISVGRFGNGQFQQDGGTSAVTGEMVFGEFESGYGNNQITGGSLTCGSLIMAKDGNSDIQHWGGRLEVTGTMTMAHGGTAQANYDLGNTGELAVGSLSIGRQGQAWFSHAGGKLTASTVVILGEQESGNGNYELDYGNASSPIIVVGQAGTGWISHYGGTLIAPSGLYLGAGTTGQGTYELDGGELSAGEIVVGQAGMGQFLHFSGNATASTLYVGGLGGGNGLYQMYDGRLSATTIRVGADGTQGRFEYYGGQVDADGGVLIGPNGTLAMCFDFNMSEKPANWDITTGTLEVCNFATATHDSGDLTVRRLVVGSEMGDGTYSLSGTASLTAGSAVVGSSGLGLLRVTGGRCNLDSLSLGEGFWGEGICTVAGSGALTATTISVGLDGVGRFAVYNNNVTASNVEFGSGGSLTLGLSTDIGGVFNGSLWHGSSPVGLALARVTVRDGAIVTQAGVSGSVWQFAVSDGTFTHSSGTLTATTVSISPEAGRRGLYQLQGTAHLLADEETIGDAADGTFTQNGGVNTTARLIVGYRAAGTYNLSGPGALVADEVIIGYDAAGDSEFFPASARPQMSAPPGASSKFSQSGGTHNVGLLRIGHSDLNPATYAISGGTLTAGEMQIGVEGPGTLAIDNPGAGVTVTGSLLLGEDASLSIVVGRSPSLLAVGGDAAGVPNARLTVMFDIPGGVDPRGGLDLGGATGLAILTSGADLTGQTFNSVTLGDTFNGGVHFIQPWRATIVGVGNNMMLKSVDFVGHGGDANLDGHIDISDLGILAGNYSRAGTWFSGDFNFDGMVDLSDLGILAGSYNVNYVNAQDLGGNGVPEPISMLLLTVGGAALLRRGR